ncbi:hypothetical protein ADL35_37650 [Streptomyces sp. NRRL WC-3753]|nr:hypothetical protein ADL35_37650 [Streptomyces sp. NRRL WC-3753]
MPPDGLTSRARMRRSRSGSMPAPSSSMTTRASAPASWAVIWMRHRSALPSSPCLTAFSTSGWRQRKGSATGSTSGATWRVTARRSPKRARTSAR